MEAESPVSPPERVSGEGAGQRTSDSLSLPPRASGELLSPSSYHSVFERWRQGSTEWRRGSMQNTSSGDHISSPSSGTATQASDSTTMSGRKKQRGRWVRSSSIRMSIAPTSVPTDARSEVHSIAAEKPWQRRSSSFMVRRSAGLSHDVSNPEFDRLASVPVEVLKLVEDASVRAEAIQYLLNISNEKRDMPLWRQRMAQFIETKHFNRIVLALIFLNCVFLAMEDPTDKDNMSTVNKVVVYSEYVFAAAFSAEMGVRIAALGLYENSFSYLRDPWNVVDGVIVVSAVTTIIVDLASGGAGAGVAISGLRALRLLRPLRAASKVEQVHIIISSLFQSLPQLADVMLLYSLFLLIFGIMAIQLWKGQLTTRCFSDLDGTLEPQDRICTSDTSRLYSYKCHWGYTCRDHQNPNHGKTSFDHIGVAILSLFTALTLEGWTDLMYDVIDATTPFASVYFIFVVLVGTFFIVNLTLAIINTSFEGNVKVLKETHLQKGDSTIMRHITSCGARGALTDPTDAHITEWRLRMRIKEIIQTDRFNSCIMILIFINTLVMATEYYGQPSELADLQEYSFWVFTAVFLTETLLKLYALSVKEFVSDKINVFDAVIVVVSLFNPVINEDIRVLMVLRSFRLMRAFKFLKQFPDLWLFVQTLENSVVGASVLTALLVLVLFIYALLGMQFFGGSFCGLEASDDDTNMTCPGRPRENFDSLGWSLLTVFTVVTGEDWNKVMYNGMRSKSDLAALYFVSLVVVGNYLVLNLFVAVLFSGLAAAEDAMDLSEQENHVAKDKKLVEKLRVLCCCWGNKQPAESMMPPEAEIKEAEEAFKYCGVNRSNAIARNRSSIKQDIELMLAEGVLKEESEGVAMWESLIKASRCLHDLPVINFDADHPDGPDTKNDHDVNILMPPMRMAFTSNDDLCTIESFVTEYAPIVFLAGDHWVRVKLRWLVETVLFEGIVLFVVLLSSVALTLEDPLAAPDTPLPRALETIDFVVAMLFTSEALLKIVAYGFVSNKCCYLRRDAWNRLDFFIVCCALLSIVFREADLSGGAVGAIEVVRMMRTLRPLRAVAKSHGMRLVLQSLLASLPSLSHVIVISTLILTIFGIMGVQFFAGRFYACTDVVWSDHSFIKTKRECEMTASPVVPSRNLRWVSHKSNFDNLGTALVTLFEIATLEGWIEVMYLGMDSGEQEHALVQNNRPWMAVYFIVFVVVGAFFLVNLFTGVLVDKYERQHRTTSAHGLTQTLSPNQIEWKQILEIMTTTMKPLNRHINAGRATLYVTNLVLDDRFDQGIMLCIALNTIVMAMEHSGQGSAWDMGLLIANIMFVIIFFVEAVMKLIALSPTGYMSDHWNKFDFSVLIISVLGIVMNITYTDGPALSVFRILRLARLLRAVRVAGGLRTLIRTLILSLRGLLNVAGLLAIFFFLYAVVGVKMFAKVERGQYLTEQANFDHFEDAVLLLFRMTTGEGWQGIMHDCQVEPPACDKHLDTCGYPNWARVYFISFILGGAFVILNLIIAVILEDFLTAQEEEALLLTVPEVNHFIACWKRYDPTGSGELETTRLLGFLTTVGLPLGFKPEWSKEQKNEKMTRIAGDMTETRGKVHIKDVMVCCGKVLVDGNVYLPKELDEVYDRRWRELFKDSLKVTTIGHGTPTSVHLALAAQKIQSIWRGKSARDLSKPVDGVPSPPSSLPSPPNSSTLSTLPSPPPDTRSPMSARSEDYFQEEATVSGIRVSDMHETGLDCEE
eukprot:TRINITY_DN9_c4_g1_i1.p1 TRINITY_DN9_c4_g1~~TRINITY_DN9_c4_g1_i1.p1  ORF type:complete len:1736 (+),score=356.14 TRINITY_DN9_c4_g1_i1:114-5321(+)